MPRDLAILCEHIDCDGLLDEWRWLVPPDHMPLMIGAFGDWIFGAPDASHWSLCLLDGDYRKVANSSEEFNRLKTVQANLNSWFRADWVVIAAEHGKVPGINECLGWKIPPAIGGPFSVDNIDVFALRVYQSIQGQLHRQLSSQRKPN